MTKQIFRVVLTGGPGAGKTTCLDRLRALGYTTGEDAAREIIRERTCLQLPPRPDEVTFAKQIFDREIAAYNAGESTPVFYERGIVDAAGYLLAAGALSAEEAAHVIEVYPYDLVFLLPPWKEIYRIDTERDHTFDHSVKVYESTVRLYRRYQYEPIEIPAGSPDSRVDTILSMVHGTTEA